ncbi:MAG: ABC transporter permease [Burkholderiales bacterium]|nr:ABC transporter permease [Burkholderiales bacterium]
MMAAQDPCRLERRADGSVLHPSGAWQLPRLTELDASLRALGASPDAGALVIDGSELHELDTAGALLLWRHLGCDASTRERIELRNFSAVHARIMELVRSRLADETPAAGVRALGWLASIGRSGVQVGALLRGHLEFFGRVLHELARVVMRPGRLRVRELFAQFAQVCVTAIPVVALVTFLIGLVVAYLLGLKAEQYGANIFVVDGVALGLAREFSPLIVATIIAGRSGAAFTAQLGTMKLTEEIDAIRTLGLSAEQVLVVPRVIALVVSLPLLVFVGDVFGLMGSMVIADSMLDITPTTFIARLQEALAPKHFVIGLAKAPVFGLFVAIIGCRMGMSVSRDTRSIGLNTTSTVVQAIVAVILLDALFALLFQELGL